MIITVRKVFTFIYFLFSWISFLGYDGSYRKGPVSVTYTNWSSLQTRNKLVWQQSIPHSWKCKILLN